MGAGTPGGRPGGFITPGGDGPGIRPPKGGDGPGIRPPKGKGEGGPKVTPAPLPPELVDKPRGEKADPNKFGKLIEGLKKTNKFKNRGPGGLGGPVTAPGFPSDGPKPPVFDDRVYAGGSSPIPGVGGHEYLNNPKYAEHRKEYYKDTESRTPSMLEPPRKSPKATESRTPSMPEFVDPAFDRDRFEKAIRGEVTLSKNERGNIEATPAGMQAPNYMPRSDYRNEIESVLEESKGARTDDVVNKIKEIEEREREKRSGRSPNRFPMGGNERDDSPFSQERFDRYQAGFRPREKEAVFFGEREPSTGSRPRTKESPKRGMRKTGRPVDAEAKNKFEEMLAYMKSFQR